MKSTAIVAFLIIASSSQVSVSPLFPLRAAVPDFVLAALVVITFFGGVREAMLAIPFAALCLGLQSNREPGLLLLGYLPLLPLAAWLAGTSVPLTGAGRFLIAGATTGVAARTLLTVSALIHGAQASLGAVIFQLIVPGAILDLALLATVYTVCRSVRWEPRELTLQRRGRYR